MNHLPHELLGAFLEAMPVGVLVIDPDERVIECNPAATRMFGRSRGDENVRCGDFLGCARRRDDPRGCGFGPRCPSCPLFAAVRAVLAGGGACDIEAEFEVETKSGTERRWFTAGVAPLVIDGRRHAMASLGDITFPKSAEETVRASEERYRLIAENTADVITLMDLSLKTTYVSPSIERVLGFSVEEELSRPLAQSLTAESWRLAEQAFADEMALEESGAADPGRTRTLELEHFCKDGSTVWLEVGLSFVRDRSGRPTGILAVSRDISERRRAQFERERLAKQVESSQRIEAVGRLAGGVAHDFNNLLTVIISHLHYGLESLPEDAPARAELDAAGKAARRAATLVRQLLAFSRRQVLQPRLMDLGRLLLDIEGMLRRILGEDVDLVIDAAGEPCIIEADPGQIEQAIMNLAVNARDAMPGGGRLTIEIAGISPDGDDGRTLPPGDYALLAVTDTGTGMDDETRRRAFEPFFTTKEPGKGTGLGLPSVHGIVEQSGGDIRILSEPGRGARFEIRLPRVAGPAVLRPVTIPPSTTAGTETVLVAEDEPAIGALARRILEGFGYQVLLATGGAEALDLAARYEGTIHLLLTDVVMPRMSGRQLADRLGADRPGLKVLFMSGYTDDVIGPYGVLDDGIRLVGKPFEAKQLALAVREALDGS